MKLKKQPVVFSNDFFLPNYKHLKDCTEILDYKLNKNLR